jgi:arsenate reductase
MAECILRRRGGGQFEAYSAGSHPRGVVHPRALELLAARGHPVDGLRSKHWNEFVNSSLALDFVFTVCDAVAGEPCPVWPGQPLTAHWGVEDPTAVHGEEQQGRVFLRVYTELERRIQLLLALPLATLDRLALKRELDLIGKGG